MIRQMMIRKNDDREIRKRLPYHRITVSPYHHITISTILFPLIILTYQLINCRKVYADYDWGVKFYMENIKGHHTQAEDWGTNGDMVSVRFTAQHTGGIDYVWLPWAGDTGRLAGKSGRLNICKDSGGNPDFANVLSTVTFTWPSTGELQQWFSWDLTGASATVTAGNVYHIVVTATEDWGTPNSKYSRLLGGTPQSQIIPKTGDTDSQATIKEYITSWATVALSPLYIVRYDAGANYQGVPYAMGVNNSEETADNLNGYDAGMYNGNAWDYIDQIGPSQSGSERMPIIKFTITDGNKGIVSLSLRLVRTSGSANTLKFRLENVSDGTVVIDTTTISDADIPLDADNSKPWKDFGWVTISFSGKVLENGKTYRLKLFDDSGPGNYYLNVYGTILEDRNGNRTGNSATPFYNLSFYEDDAYIEYLYNGTYYSHSEADAGFYFTVDETPPTFAITAPASTWTVLEA